MSWIPRLIAIIWITSLAACHAPGHGSADAQQGESLTVMSFNIRYGTASDGDHAWPARRALVAERISAISPDVLAIQEGLDFQLEELKETLAGYTKLGQHREGGTRGEFSGLYVRDATVELLGWGELWLSPEPDTVGSKGWDAALPRMAVWADVQSRAGGRALRVYGTHYDHRGASARLESSRLLLRDAANQPAVVITGDFNATEESAPMQAFFAAGWKSAVRVLLPNDTRGTFNGFRDPTGGRRIDHLMYRGLEPSSAQILGGRMGELFPSDHDAVVAEFRVD